MYVRDIVQLLSEVLPIINIYAVIITSKYLNLIR